jgi:type I restriction enzyme, S subunit
MSEWNEFILSDIMDILGGGTPKTSIPEYWGGEIPWLSVVDFGNDSKYVYKTEKNISALGLQNSSTRILKTGQIIISARGTVGELAMIKGEMAFNQSCYGINAKEKICINNYLYYLLKCKIVELKRNAHGAVFDTITRATFDTISVKIPDLKTQYSISEILSSLDDKIELNNKINQELESLAQLLFKRWLVDFEFPNEKGEPYKSSGGEMVDSELGEIPKGWEVFKFKEIVEKYIDNRGKTPPSSEFGIPLVEVKHMSDNEMFPTLKTDKYLSQEVYDTFLRGYLEEKDILMSTVGTIGRLNLVRGDEKFAIAQNVLGVRFNKKFVSQYFMYFQMKSKQFNEEIKSRLIETVQSSIKRSDIEKIPIKVPMSYLVEHFDEQVDSIVGQIAVLSKENQNLKILRDTLLPRLISGEIQINEN